MPKGSIFKTKSIADLIAASEHPNARLHRTLGLGSLIALGIGSVIGAGIFTMTGTAAAGMEFSYESILKAPLLDLILHGSDAVGLSGRPGAGPGLSLSFILVAIACGFAALCYAELASMIPVAGSAYTYAYATMGEIIAWIIGWDLILEYAVGNMAVAVGFSAYFNDLIESVAGVRLPESLSNPVFIEGVPTGAYFNLPAFILITLITFVLLRGIGESARVNNVMVVLKVLVILAFIFGASQSINTANWTPFMPNGFSGVITGGALVFFAYIGFDSISTAAEECKDPQRTLPLGIIITLGACTILYCAVSLVLTGIVPWQTLDNAAPVSNALRDLGYERLRIFVSFGATLGMMSSLMIFQYGQIRIWYVMGRDRLLPDRFANIDLKHRSPTTATWIAGAIVGVGAGILDIGTLGDLTNIGTLFAFCIVSGGVIVLRRTQPDHPRSFRVPLVPWIPALAILCCFGLMLGLPVETWLRFFIWLGLGLAIYFGYGRKRTALYPH